MNDPLDTLLSRPLGDVPDNGFTNRVAAQMELVRLRRDRLMTDVCSGVVLFGVLVLPFTRAGEVLAASASTPVGMALIGMASVGTVALITLRKFSR